LANTPNEKLAKAYEDLVNETLVDEIRQLHERPAKVVFARDTRASGPYLITALKAALDAVKVDYTDYGILTTPQLHYIVRCINTMNSPYAFGVPTEQGYYDKMSKAFKTIMHGRTIHGPITVDCANGVGGPKLKELLKYLPNAKAGGVDIKVVNDDVVRPEALNFEVRQSYQDEGDGVALIRSLFPLSVAPTLSRPSNELHPTPTLNPATAAVLSTGTPIASSTTTPTNRTASTCSMGIALPPWARSSLPT
jgi:hypothetical protein